MKLNVVMTLVLTNYSLNTGCSDPVRIKLLFFLPISILVGAIKK